MESIDVEIAKGTQQRDLEIGEGSQQLSSAPREYQLEITEESQHLSADPLPSSRECQLEINEGTQQPSADPLPLATKYLEALEAAVQQNTIVSIESGSAKTLIAKMLFRCFAHLLWKHSPFLGVFLAPTFALVQQQCKALKMHSELKVGKYCGGEGVACSDVASWRKKEDKYEVLVMTPTILLEALRHGFLKIGTIRVLIFDECHHARGEHPYACIMKEFYHPELNSEPNVLPRILGLTASPINAKDCSSELACREQIQELENLMHSKIFTCATESVLAKHIPFSTTDLTSNEQRDIPKPEHVSASEAVKTVQIKKAANSCLPLSLEIKAFILAFVFLIVLLLLFKIFSKS